MKKLIINGRMRITLTPLLKDTPIVGTMQACCTGDTPCPMMCMYHLLCP